MYEDYSDTVPYSSPHQPFCYFAFVSRKSKNLAKLIKALMLTEMVSLASLAAPLPAPPPSRWTATADCAGVSVNGACWVLGGPGQSCPDMCGGRALVDRQTTIDGSSSRDVVVALTVRYGLPPWRRAQSLDQRCVASSFDTASFLYLQEAQTWDCFQGEDKLALGMERNGHSTGIAPVFRSGCVCYQGSPPPSPPPPPPDYRLYWLLYAVFLMLVTVGLCSWCCCCCWQPPRQPRPQHFYGMSTPRRNQLLARFYQGRLGEFHPDSPLFRMSTWRVYHDADAPVPDRPLSAKGAGMGHLTEAPSELPDRPAPISVPGSARSSQPPSLAPTPRERQRLADRYFTGGAPPSSCKSSRNGAVRVSLY